MDSMIDNYSIDEIENSLCEIDEVKAARIVVGHDQGIEEIHILANPSKGPKQLSRDVESVLMARYGLPVNHRKISIAQIGSQDIKKAAARARIISVKHEVFGNRAKVSVSLEHNGNQYEGVEEGAATKLGRLRLVASATLRAVEKIVPETYGFSLEDITAINLGRDIAVVTSVAVLSISGEETFVGCTLVKDDQREAIVKAVLDAVNRRLSFLVTA